MQWTSEFPAVSVAKLGIQIQTVRHILAKLIYFVGLFMKYMASSASSLSFNPFFLFSGIRKILIPGFMDCNAGLTIVRSDPGFGGSWFGSGEVRSRVEYNIRGER